ncbi:methyltransferase domain-containing protein [Streptomyces sp. NPDC020965]|uniref:methyltransferase domain-containing protein n=1 Tax=Streptomyces sp. NPDC020965 TaxID=3365105 RepID=UPI00378DC562
MTNSFADVRPRIAAFTERLRRDGAIASTPWADAFTAVPRHVFVPSWYEQGTDDRGICVWTLRDGAYRARWLDAAYSDTTLVTALDPATAEQVGDRTWTGMATSSSTMPSVMAGMLEELAVRDGHRVLEVGTGTGYNAALLCARLGDHLVHSVDIDPGLVRVARSRLAEIGYAPHLIAGDGQDGCSSGERFDRIIATCAVPRIPSAWIEQTRPGGVILADLGLGIEGGLVCLTLAEDGSAQGPFARTGGRFMPARTGATGYPDTERAPYAPEAVTRPTPVGGAEIRGEYGFRLLLAFTLPEAEFVYHLDDTNAVFIQFQTPDGSWARTPVTGGATVTHGGDHSLWERVEEAWSWWNRHGRPEHTQYGITREPDGRTHAWHGPDDRRWPLDGRPE